MITQTKDYEMYVKQELEQRYPDCRVDLVKVQKNNGIVINGITILAPGENISPTIFLDKFIMDGYSVDEICNEVSGIYEENRNKKELKTDLTDFEAVCGRICFQLVNAEKNEEWLKTIPHRRLHDLAVIYYILMDDQFDGMATIKITDQLAACWGVDEEKLYAYAEENTRKLLHIVVKPLDMAIICHMADEGQQDYEMIASEDFSMTRRKSADLNLYVMSNKDKTLGAATILYADILREISELLEDDFFILPSSTHEVLIIPENNAMDSNELFQMVCEVNENDVSQEDFLADNVYYYNREENTVRSLYYREA